MPNIGSISGVMYRVYLSFKIYFSLYKLYLSVFSFYLSFFKFDLSFNNYMYLSVLKFYLSLTSYRILKIHQISIVNMFMDNHIYVKESPD